MKTASLRLARQYGNLSQKHSKQNAPQFIECLSSMHKTLGLILSTAQVGTREGETEGSEV